MRTIAMSPIKGGVGKTAILLSLAGYYAKKNKKVLCIGLDSQRNLSNFLEQEESDNELDIHDVLVNKIDIKKAIKDSRFKNIQYVPDAKKLGERGVFVDKIAIKEALQSVYNEFDYVLIDNSPTLTSGAVSSFVASDAVIVAIEPDRFSLENIVDTTQQIANTNMNAEIYITPSKSVANSKVHKELREAIGEFVDGSDNLNLTDSIPYSIEMTNRIYDGQILVQHKAFSNAHRNLKQALEKLAKEVR